MADLHFRNILILSWQKKIDENAHYVADTELGQSDLAPVPGVLPSGSENRRGVDGGVVAPVHRTRETVER